VTIKSETVKSGKLPTVKDCH